MNLKNPLNNALFSVLVGIIAGILMIFLSFKLFNAPFGALITIGALTSAIVAFFVSILIYALETKKVIKTVFQGE